MLDVVTIETPGLGDRSYVVSDGRAAVVVDPQRDIDRVRAVLEDLGVPLSHVLETHVHNDYVTGGLELARSTGAAYVVAAQEDVAYQRYGVADGDVLTSGSMSLHVLATPGHTPSHLSYLVEEPEGPGAVFTGGSLLYGTVGRTDLIAPERTEPLARAQYRSARRLLALPGEVAVYPTHGFGSFCASGSGSGASSATVAQERAGNGAATADEDAFVAELLAGLAAYPRYYAHMAPLNRRGPAPLDLSPPRVLSPAELAGRLAAGDWVVDVRQRRDFAARHLAGTVNVGLSDGLATYLGWVVPWGRPLVLVGDTAREVADAQRALARIGIDRPAGCATGGVAAYGAAGPPGSYGRAHFRDLAARWEGRTFTVLDVRTDHEWRDGHLRGAVHVPLPDVEAREPELGPHELWVHCKSGFRASIAASLLARAGHPVVLVDDDFDAAAAAGLPLEVGAG